MVKYESPSQLKIKEFKTPFLKSLLPDNRCVMLSKIVPWDKFASIYLKAMETGTDRPSISPRIVLGALIKLSSKSNDKKHNENPKEKKDDGSTENNGRLQMDATVADQYIAHCNAHLFV